MSEIEINGITYVPKHAPADGTRRVVVIDRGWIFGGNVERDDDEGVITITDAVHVIRWEAIGFDGVCADKQREKMTLKRMDKPVVVPMGSVIFSVVVADTWGR